MLADEPDTPPLPPVIDLDSLIECYKTDPDTRMTHQKWAAWSCDCAERALPRFEQYHPDDMRPRQALEAARAWVANPTRENREAARAAAYAAARAAARAAADAAALTAADAAALTAADAAADAADAAYAAARAAADAAALTAADAAAAEQWWQALRLMEIYHG